MSLYDSQTGYKETLDGYDDFKTYFFVGYLRDITNFGHSDVQSRITSRASILLSRISHSNKNTTVSSTF